MSCNDDLAVKSGLRKSQRKLRLFKIRTIPGRFPMFQVLLFLPFLMSVASANVFYVRPNGASYGSGNGTSWENAWSGFGAVVWGSGAGQLGAGDTLFVGAGNYSTGFTAGGSGSAGNYINIRAAQDSYTGIATIARVNMASKNYINMDGSFNGGTNFVFAGGIAGQAARYCKWSYFKYTNAVIDLRYSGNNEVSYYQGVLTTGTSEETTLYGIASLNTTYDQTLIHHGHVLVPGQINNGNGPDGVHTGTGFTWSNMVFQAFAGAYSGSQHQDLIQCYGDKYLKVVNCEFIDSGDSQIDLSESGNIASMGHYRIWNNVFRRTIENMGTVMIRNYTDGGGVISSYTDFHIENNTFIDGARTGSSYGAAIRLQAGSGSTTSTDCAIQNNIIFNCGRAWPAILVEGVTANWTFAYNLINAGGTGNTGTSSWSQSNGQSGAPTFASYTAYNMGNNVHLASGDSAARGNGTALNSLFTTDKDGVTRGATWDIGAYEYDAAGGGGGSGGGDVTNASIRVSVTTLDFGAQQVGEQADRSVIVLNVGAGDLIGQVNAIAPFSIVSGGSYSLSSNQSQTVTVRYAPTVAGIHSQVITFTGGDSATISVSGTAWTSLSGNTFLAIDGIITGPFVGDPSGYVLQTSETTLASSGRAEYSFTVTNAGNYLVTMLVNAPDTSANSLFVNIDAEPSDPLAIWDIPVTSGFESRTVAWRGMGTDVISQFNPKIFSLSTGTHQLVIRGREANVQFSQVSVVKMPGPPSNLTAISQ